MRGSITKHRMKSGQISWGYYARLGKDLTGKWRQVSKKGFTTKRQCEDALRQVIAEYENATSHNDPRTFGEIFDFWIKEHCERNCEASTTEGYVAKGSYAKRLFGDVPLAKLKPLQIESSLNTLKDSGGKKTTTSPQGRPLSPKTVREVAAVINATFNAAIRWGIIETNPMLRVTLPRLHRKEPMVLEKSDLERVIAAVEGHEWLHSFLLLDIATGCRRGELLALTWSDIDFENTTLTISKSLSQTKFKGVFLKLPKGRKARQFSLSPSAIEALRTHRTRQAELALLIGDLYQSEPSLVFANTDGTYLKPDSVTAKVSLTLRKLGFPRGFSLHSLRHSHGSHLLSLGVPLTAVSKRLGHANTHITASVYAHALEKDESKSAEAWELAMGNLGRKAKC